MTLLLDWISREGTIVFAWWLWITLAGVAVFPLCLRLLGGLPDKGYTLARALGMLMVTFVFWLLGSYGFLDNSTGSIIWSWLLVLISSLVLYQRMGDRGEFAAWWRENRMLVVAAELLSVILFFGWALFRAHQNDIVGTEKPMELAFLSATQRSTAFPPNDPWMSGYAISYYYMGYLMSSALSMLSGVGSTIGFNLTIASQFALTGLAAFGVVYNLARSRAIESFGRSRRGAASRRVAIATGVLAMALIVLLGNFQMVFIEAPFQSRLASQSYLDYWGTQERSNFVDDSYRQDPEASLRLNSANWNSWWWFRASRVLTDYDLKGNQTGIQPINEFPAFSFILSDNHPHVLALPFVVAVIGMMLNLVLLRRQPAGGEVLLYGVAVGGLAFLNAWDGAIYLFGLVGAEALRRLLTSERGKLTIADWLGLLRFGAWLMLVAFVAYLPYFVGFRSQAGGILPNLLHPTLFQRFFIMFGPLMVILFVYLIVECWRGRGSNRLNWRFGIKAGGGLLIALLGSMTVFGVLIAISSPNVQVVGNLTIPSEETGELLLQLVTRRIENGLTTVILLLGIVAVLARLFPSQRQAILDAEVAIRWIKYSNATGFALLLIGMGLFLALFPEFFYLKDNFGVRINTIFKFYYQAWILWSIAAAYAVYSMLGDSNIPRPYRILRLGIGTLFALSIAAGLVYTAEGTFHRAWIETGRHAAVDWRRYAPPADSEDSIRRVAEGERVDLRTVLFSRGDLIGAEESDLVRSNHAGIVTFHDGAVIVHEPLTLDGAGGLLQRDDQNVIMCLSQMVGRTDVVVAEAVGDPYRIEYGRVGTLTGIPIVLGWENHERQWRGPTYYEIAGTRSADLKSLYTAAEMTGIDEIIDRYDIDYILYGTSERLKYGDLGEEKFLDYLPIVCQSGESRIYFSGHQRG